MAKQLSLEALSRAVAMMPADQKKNLLASLRSGLTSVVSAARRDPSVFAMYVLRDERTGDPIKQAPIHKKWQNLINDCNRLVLWSHVDAGKTNQIAIARVLYELGRNHNLRVAIVSKTNELAMAICRTIGQYIENSTALHEVFPDLRANHDPALPWTSHSLTIERAVRAKDPSVRACGVHGNIHGSRIDLLILDDVIDSENTRTHAPRERLWNWVRSTLFGRLTEKARVVVMGNAWHPEDLLHRLEREPRFVGVRFPVIDAAGNLTWPEHWDHERIDNARADMGPLEFSRALLCQARDDETARFKKEFINKCTARGHGKRLVSSAADLYDALVAEGEISMSADQLAALSGAQEASRRLGAPLDQNPLGICFYTGVDLAVSRGQSADLTCLFTIAIFPNGDRRVLEVTSGRWSAPEIMDKIKDAYLRFGSIVIVENNAAQDYIVQILQQTTAIPVVPFTTGHNKARPETGVEHLAVEFNASKWIIPSGEDGNSYSREIAAWIQELYHYEPPPVHTGDRLMASWFAREGHRRVERANDPRGGGSVGVRVLGV